MVYTIVIEDGCWFIFIFIFLGQGDEHIYVYACPGGSFASPRGRVGGCRAFGSWFLGVGDHDWGIPYQ